jgi:hypothetical protein
MKSINIKGKNYITVSERILEFNKEYPQGSITCNIIEHDFEKGIILMEAVVIPNHEEPNRFFNGFATEWRDDSNSFVNKTSYIENCNTSAVGRALGMLGIGIDTGFASFDEIGIAQKKEQMLKCSNCKNDITQAEQLFSLKKYKKVLCRNCQSANDKKEPF